LLFFLLSASVAAVLLLLYCRSVRPAYVGLYPYLGEKELNNSASSEILNILWNQWKAGRSSDININALCNRTLRVGDSAAYVDCSVVGDSIVFPRAGGERLELPAYIQGHTDLRKVWSAGINMSVSLGVVVQGVYKVPGFDSYYFRAVPGLPICVRIRSPEELHPVVTVKVNLEINGEPVEPEKVPGFIVMVGVSSICFDSTGFLRNLNSKDLEWRGFKPLMNLREGINNFSFRVEVYADSDLLDKEFAVDILVGPPYVEIQHLE